jgi:hypothetical protein
MLTMHSVQRSVESAGNVSFCSSRVPESNRPARSEQAGRVSVHHHVGSCTNNRRMTLPQDRLKSTYIQCIVPAADTELTDHH